MYYQLFICSLVLLNSVFLITLCSFDNVVYFDEEHENDE
jgi:hypothetical protein